MDCEKYTVAVIDSLPVIVEGVRALIETTPDFELAATFDSLETALPALRSSPVSVLLCDRSFRREQLLAFVRDLRAVAGGTEIVVWGTAIGGSDGVQLLRAGVKGILRKSSSPEQILQCLRNCVAGQPCLPEDLFAGLQLGKAVPRALLTKREREVLQLVAAQRSNKEIAEALGIQPGTLKVHLRKIFTKTGVHNRHGLALLELEHSTCA